MFKKAMAVLLAALMIAGLCACAGGSSADGTEVTVQSVADITGMGSLGVVERYAGKVVSGQTEKITRDTNKKVGEVFVAEGDEVTAGDVLFNYDTQSLQFSLEKLELELEGYENAISSGNEQITELEKERSSASSSQQLAYTLQIQSTEADIREAEYNKGLKEREIANMRTSLENTEVRATLTGRVMSVASTDDTGESYSYSGDSSDNAFITISDMKTFRVEGNVNELNAGSITEGMSVLIRSRMDENVTWQGTIEKIDWENPVKNDANGVYYYSNDNDDMTQSSKYPFYVALSSKDGLILGQHVYIEPDYGQSGVKTGLWLPEYYLADTGANAYVWAAGKKDTLEKRSVELGEYDAELGEYEILSGLSTQDYIAFPDDTMQAGLPVVRAEAGDMGDMSYGGESYSDEGYESYESYSDEGNSFESFETYETFEDVTPEAGTAETVTAEAETLPEAETQPERGTEG